MNTESVDCVRLSGEVFPEGLLSPGQFVWSEARDNRRTLYIVLPGSNYPLAIDVNLGFAGGYRVWGWDGNEEKPTLSPSIDWPGKWHGHLVAGRLISV